MNNKLLAKNLLNRREDDASVLGGFRSISKRLIFRLLILLVSAGLYVFSDNPLFLVLIGFVLGLFVQDFAWFKSVSDSWHFMKSVIDWNLVEAVAKSDDQSSKSEA